MALTKPVFSGSSSADAEAFKQQMIQYYIQSGDTTPDRNATFNDPKYGSLNLSNINKAGTLEYSLYNPTQTVKTATGLQEANQIFSSATGKQLTGDGLVAVEGALRQGYSATDALKNLGDLSNYAKFSTDYNGGTSGGPAGPGGADLSGTPGFWEASPGVTTPQAASVVTPEQRAALANAAVSGTQVLPVDTSQKSPVKTATNTVKGYDVNNNYAEVWVKPGEYVPGVSLTKPTITPGSMENAGHTKTPGAEQSYTADTVVAGASSGVKSLEDYVALFTTPLTEGQKKEQSIADELAKLIGDSTNRSAEQLAEEQKAGIPEMTAQVKEVISQINTKMAEFEAFKLAQEGKPITMSSIVGNIAQQKNQIASEILLLQAKGEAIQGRLDTAQANVNRAIDLKYETIDAKYKLYQAQLEALKPTLTREENIRAMAMEAMYNDRQQALDAIRQEEKDIQSLMLEAIKGGVRDSSALNKIGSAKSFTEAAKLLGQYLPESSGELLSPTEAAALNVPYGTTKEQAANMGISPRDIKGTLTPQEIINLEMKLNKDVFTSTKEAREAERNVSIMNTALQTAKQQIANGGDIGSSSQAIITTFNKILDPTSVVRESEYARTPEGVSLINKIQGYYTKLASGGAGLTVDSLQEYVNTANQFLQNYTDSQISVLDRARTQAENYGLNLNNILDSQAQTILNQYDNKQLQNYYGNLPANEKLKIDALFRDNPNLSSHDILSIVNGSFNEVGGDTKTATKVAAISDGTKGGQCGRFVNQLTGLGVGDSYQSKIAKMDPTIKYPQPGMVFVMPSNGAYSEYGHVGIILSVSNGIATVKDSNWRGDEKVLTHQIPISKMTGFAYA